MPTDLGTPPAPKRPRGRPRKDASASTPSAHTPKLKYVRTPREDEAPPPNAEELLALWEVDYWAFLTARIGTRPVILTKDEKDEGNPYRPLPPYPYLKDLADVLMSEKVVFVDKARQLMVTHLMLLLAFWFCAFKKGRRVILSKSTEDDAKELLGDKIMGPWSRMPGWVQEALPIRVHGDVAMPSRITFTKSDSYILGLPQNIAKRARGGTPSLVIVDEAAFQDQLADILTTLFPMDCKVWAASTPGDAGPGALTWIRYVDVALGKEAGSGQRKSDSVEGLGAPVVNEPEEPDDARAGARRGRGLLRHGRADD